jgi:hypothetical protein
VKKAIKKGTGGGGQGGAPANASVEQSAERLRLAIEKADPKDVVVALIKHAHAHPILIPRGH